MTNLQNVDTKNNEKDLTAEKKLKYYIVVTTPPHRGRVIKQGGHHDRYL